MLAALGVGGACHTILHVDIWFVMDVVVTMGAETHEVGGFQAFLREQQVVPRDPARCQGWARFSGNTGLQSGENGWSANLPLDEAAAVGVSGTLGPVPEVTTRWDSHLGSGLVFHRAEPDDIVGVFGGRLEIEEQTSCLLRLRIADAVVCTHWREPDDWRDSSPAELEWRSCEVAAEPIQLEFRGTLEWDHEAQEMADTCPNLTYGRRTWGDPPEGFVLEGAELPLCVDSEEPVED